MTIEISGATNVAEDDLWLSSSLSCCGIRQLMKTVTTECEINAFRRSETQVMLLAAFGETGLRWGFCTSENDLPLSP